MTDTLQRSVVSEDRAAEILAAADVVLGTLGHDKLSLAQVARVSLIPLARIYQYFADKNAILGALSARELTRLTSSVDTRGAWSPAMDIDRRVDRVIERLAGFLETPSAAYLVLCGPFDETSVEPRLQAVHGLGLALQHAHGEHNDVRPHASGESLDYAAELVFACFRRSYQLDGRITATAIDMAQHAARSFLAGIRYN